MIAAVVLAGGEGRRFGGVDKAFLLLHGRPLIAHVMDRLRPQIGAIAISANGDAARFGPYTHAVLADAADHAGKGPLAGVAAGLAWAEGQGAAALLSVPVDTPFFPRNLVDQLAPAPTVACYQGRQHHLVALWPVSVRTRLTAFLVEPGRWRVRDALELCAARPVQFAERTDPFANINTPEDLAAARRIP